VLFSPDAPDSESAGPRPPVLTLLFQGCRPVRWEVVVHDPDAAQNAALATPTLTLDERLELEFQTVTPTGSTTDGSSPAGWNIVTNKGATP
jgi:hypothetical protein